MRCRPETAALSRRSSLADLPQEGGSTQSTKALSKSATQKYHRLSRFVATYLPGIMGSPYCQNGRRRPPGAKAAARTACR